MVSSSSWGLDSHERRMRLSLNLWKIIFVLRCYVGRIMVLEKGPTKLKEAYLDTNTYLQTTSMLGQI